MDNGFSYALPYGFATLAALLAIVAGVIGYVRSEARGDAVTSQQLAYVQELQETNVQLRRELARSQYDVSRLWGYVYTLRGLLARHAPNVEVPDPPTLGRANGNGDTTPQSLQDVLLASLSLEELCQMAFDLGIDAEGLETKGAVARRILGDMKRRNRAEDVKAWIREHRKDINL